MKKKPSDRTRSEYRFDYSASKPNRFAPQIKEGSVAVVLEPDVAAVFADSESGEQDASGGDRCFDRSAEVQKEDESVLDR
jgi:hypothetical protein